MLFGGPLDIEKLRASGNVRGLIKALGYRDLTVAGKAAGALADLGDATAVDPLSAALDKNDGPHLAVVKALTVFISDPRAMRCLITAAMLNQAQDVRQAATDCLASLGNVKAIQEEVSSRISALQAHLIATPILTSRLGFDAVELTLSTLKTEVQLRVAAIDLLSRLAGAEAARPALLTFESSSKDAHRRAAHELAKLIDRSAVGKVDAILKNTNEQVRDFAVMVLQELEKLGK